jgi:hypothetical protein
MTFRHVASALALLSAACSGDADPGAAPPASTLCPGDVGDGALSTHLRPRLAAADYVAEANRYFDAIDVTAPASSVPTYSELVARWEWPPWLKLTGYTRAQMIDTDRVVKTSAPAAVTHRDCRAFDVQPFARCRVSFDYEKMGEGKPCLIYEEFTFNDQGEITFIEAWSDMPQHLPSADPADRWAEGAGIHRLSTKIPGLGTATGRIDPTGACMQQAAAVDAEVADFATRTGDFWKWWLDASAESKDYFARGCGW